MSNHIKIVLADDHPIVRQGLRQIIEKESDLLIVAECENGQETIDCLAEHQPQVLILDVDMPLLNGFEVLRHLQQQRSAVKIIFLTVHNEIEFVNEATRLGVKAYILKESAIEEIVEAIRVVISGKIYSSQKVAQFLTKQNGQNESIGISALTPTEREILKMIADYKTSQEIGDKFFISPLTVKTHRRNISLKLDIIGNNALMKFALQNRQLL